MKIEELDDILRKGEGITIEYKEAQGGVPSSLYETVVSFSNTKGGTIVLGAEDDGTIVRLDPNKTSGYIKDIVSSLNDPEKISPSLFLQPQVIEHPNGHVIVIQVPVSSQIHRHVKRVYWRSDDNDQDVTNDEQKVSDIYFQKREYFSETEIFPYLSYEDLDENLFIKAKGIIRSQNPSHPWLLLDNEKILRSSSLYRKDFKTGEEGLTRAAALIFGKNDTIAQLLPGYKLDAIVRRNNLDRYDDRITLRTNLIDSYMLLMDFVKKHLSEKFYQDGSQRQDLRELIFREVIGNMIVHREYASAVSSDFIIHKNEVKVTNPNKSLFNGPLDLNTFNPYPKNPNIRKFFTAFGWTDELGSGVRNTNKYLDFYAPGAKPVFIEGDNFITEIPLISLSLADFGDKLLNWFGFEREPSEHVKDKLHTLVLDTSLVDTTWDHLILHLVPSWSKKGTKLKPLDWPKKQPSTQGDIEMVPSWNEKGTKLLHKKTSYLIRILLFTVQPVSLDHLMSFIGYANKNTFRRNYLIPLQQVGFVKMTNPDSPKAPYQKYVITENGKRFLTGREEV